MARICIVGRPNVGKSTLFNRLTRRRVAITDPTPGVTRDAITSAVEIAGRRVTLVDTGGLTDPGDPLEAAVMQRSSSELRRADLVLALVSVGERTGEDEELFELVRRSGRPTILVVNKVDNEARAAVVDEWWSAGIDPVVAISAAHGLGMDDLEDAISAALGPVPGTVAGDAGESENAAGSQPDADGESDPDGARDDPDRPVRLAIVGQPNTGKSSLLNRLVGSERAIVSEIAGTTRDVVQAEFETGGQHFEVVDTAGIRRRSRVSDSIEYYSVTRAFDAIDRSELAVLVVDADKGLSEQDKKIAGRINERGCGVVVALNKWDLVPTIGNARNAIIDRVRFLFPVFDHVPIVPISALDGSGVPELIRTLITVRTQLYHRIETAALNQRVRSWVEETPPPSGRRPVKVRYMTQVSTNPVRFILFVNRPQSLPRTYLGYIRNRLRRDCGFSHVPLFIDVRG